MNTTVNLRLDSDLKSSLQELANEYGYSLSDYLREILNNHLDDFSSQEIKRDEIEIGNNEPLPFEQSYDFTILVAWLFYKYIYPKNDSSTQLIELLKQHINKAIYQSSLSNTLQSEFLKVEADMHRFLLEPDHPHKHFLFPLRDNHFSFDYNLLLNELWSLKPIQL